MKEMLNVFWERLSENWLDIIYKKWKEIPSVYWKSFFIVFIGVNIAFAAYTFAFIGGDHFLTEGRFIRPIAFNTLTYIGRFADQYIPFLLTRSLVLPVLTAFYGFLGLSLGAIALCVYWRVPKSIVSYSIVGLLVSIQPYTLAWVWSFFVMIEMLWIPVCVIAAYILAEKAGSHGKIKKIVYISLSVLLFIIPLGTHQSTINIMAIVFLGRIIIDIFLEWDATVSSLKKIVLKFRYSVLAAGLGGFLYGFIFLLLKFNGIIPTGNGDYHLRTFTGFSDFAANFIKIIDISFTRMWQYPAPFFPPSLIKSFAIISYCGFILVLLNIFIDNTKTKNQKFIKGIVITIFILFIIAFSNIMAMLTPVDFVANSPRILFLSVPFLCVLPIVLFLIQRFQFPKNVIIVACIVLINMCLIQDSLVVRVWKNGYEAEKMLWNRLIMRIELSPSFNKETRYTAIFIGNRPSYRPYYYYRTKESTLKNSDLLNRSFLGVHAAVTLNFFFPDMFITGNTNIFRQTLGSLLNNSSWNKNKKLFNIVMKMKDEINNAQVWPAQNSIIVKDDIIIFVFDKNELEKIKKTIQEL